jgi:hypothetical protein
MVWNFVIYCISLLVPFCEKNPEIRQDIPQNYQAEPACVDSAVAAANKYKFDNPDVELKFSCIQGARIVLNYEPERISPPDAK